MALLVAAGSAPISQAGVSAPRFLLALATGFVVCAAVSAGGYLLAVHPHLVRGSTIGWIAATVALADPEQHDLARDAIRPLPGLDHITDAEGGLAVYVENGAHAVAELVQLLTAAGVEPGAISLSRPTLDDVFLAFTGRRIETSESAA